MIIFVLIKKIGYFLGLMALLSLFLSAISYSFALVIPSFWEITTDGAWILFALASILIIIGEYVSGKFKRQN
jgi:hypothetical protein